MPRHSLVHNITVPDPRKVYQFAISANTARASSGMMWASCTVIHNKVVGKMKTVWIHRTGSTMIEVGWKLDCSDRIGIVDGFKIYYCPIVSPYNVTCKGPKLNTTIKADLNTIRGEVRGLKPYTTYMIAVAVLTKVRRGASGCGAKWIRIAFGWGCRGKGLMGVRVPFFFLAVCWAMCVCGFSLFYGLAVGSLVGCN